MKCGGIKLLPPVSIKFSLRAQQCSDGGDDITINIDRADHTTLIDNEAAAMDIPVTDQHDGFSDYGSDFSAGEEEIINGLLHQNPEQDDDPTRDLLLQDIEHEKGPRGAKVPCRQYQQNQEQPLLLLYQTNCAIQLDGDHNPSANSMCRACSHSKTIAD